jgi:hypothetical protein
VNNIFKIALIAGAAWLLTKIAAALSLKLSPGGIGVSGSSLSLKLQILNTSTFPIGYDNFNGSVYINNSLVGTVYDNTAQQIIGNGVTDLTLLFSPLPGTLISDIISEVSTGASDLVQVKGILTAENIPIPISLTYVSPDLSGAASQVQNLLSNIGL